MPRATWGVLGWIFTHLTVALLVALTIIAWVGWHRPPQIIQTVSKEVQQVPVGGEKAIVVTVPGIGSSLPQVVTAPAPDVRVITAPPVVVTPQQQAAVESKAPVVITVPLLHDCVHPDTAGAPDPTCGKPADPTLTLVRAGDGYTVLHQPSDQLVTGPVQTRLNDVRPVARHPWEVRVGAGVSNLFNGSAYVRGELDYHPLPSFDALYVGAGVQRFSSSPITNGYVEIGVGVRF